MAVLRVKVSFPAIGALAQGRRARVSIGGRSPTVSVGMNHGAAMNHVFGSMVL